MRKGERVYAIGDIHGRFDLLRILIGRVIAHFEHENHRPDTVLLLFLGDIVDRGPDSAACLAQVRRLSKTGGAKTLRGNHEDMMLASIDGNPAAQRAWLAHGGRETLASYGIAEPEPGEDAFDFAERLAAGVPAEDVAFLRSLEPSYVSGDYLFVHAGIRPGIPLADQDENDLLSIRDDFTASHDRHEKIVVHGHSIVDGVEMHHNRIAVDTGAYRSGLLSCVCLERDAVTVLTS